MAKILRVLATGPIRPGCQDVFPLAERGPATATVRVGPDGSATAWGPAARTMIPSRYGGLTVTMTVRGPAVVRGCEGPPELFLPGLAATADPIRSVPAPRSAIAKPTERLTKKQLRAARLAKLGRSH